MIKEIECCCKKDIMEFYRHRLNILCAVIIICIGACVLLATVYFPSLILAASSTMPEIITDTNSLTNVIEKLFPSNVKSNMGIFSSDVVVFYGLILIYICTSVLPNEIMRRQWIIPLSVGYRRETILISKCIVYTVGTSFPVFVIGNIYYMVAACVLKNDMAWGSAVLNIIALTISIACISIISLFLSIIITNRIMAVFTIVSLVMVAPDIMTFFSFGEYLPTYLLTLVYNSEVTLEKSIIPVCNILLIIVTCYLLAVNKLKKIIVER